MRSRRSRSLVVAGLLATGLVAACGDDGASRSGAPVAPTTPTPTLTAGSPATSSSPTPSTGVPVKGFGTAAVVIRRADGSVCELCTYVARTSTERARGLMEVTDLEGHDGMVFVYEAAGVHTFWMKDTVMPLTAGWFGPDGSFVAAVDMEPCPPATDRCPSYGPDTESLHVLEVPQGDLIRLGIGDGAVLEAVGEPCRPGG